MSPAARPKADLYLSILLRRLAPGMWAIDELTDAVVEQLEALGKQTLHFDLRGAVTKDDVLKALGTQGDFPTYYGRNWDAAYDCLTELEPGLVLVRGTSEIEPSAVSTLAGIFSDAATHWAAQSATYVVWEGPASDEAPALPR